MDALIEQMYMDAMIIEDLRIMIQEAAMNHGYSLSHAWNRANRKMGSFVERLAQKDIETGSRLLAKWQQTGEDEVDFRALAYKTEKDLIPAMIRGMEVIYGDIKVPCGRWSIEKSTVGFFTIRNNILTIFTFKESYTSFF